MVQEEGGLMDRNTSVESIEAIREEISNNVGKNVKLKANVGRRKIYESTGIIEQAYSSIFLVRLDNESKGTVTFSYSDVLTKTVQLLYKN
jgi:uncharacterized protein Veg